MGVRGAGFGGRVYGVGGLWGTKGVDLWDDVDSVRS